MEWLIALIAFAAAVALLFVLIRAIARGAFGRSRRLEAELGREALASRRNAGKISQAEHDAASTTLGNG
jgi:hypothetical protein